MRQVSIGARRTGRLREGQAVLGELYRKRRDDGDLELAIAEYRLALAEPACPPRAHRNLAQALIRSGQPLEALKCLERYLEANPDAPDRKIVERQLQELR